MEIGIRDLKACERGLIRLMNSELPAKTSFKLTAILKTVRDRLQILEQTRTDLIRKYGEQGKDGAVHIMPGSEGEAKFRAEFDPIMEETVILERFKPLTLDDICDARISPVELEPLMGKFIRELQTVSDPAPETGAAVQEP